MPRTLPWLLEPSREVRVKQESTPRKRVKREPAPDSDKTPKQEPASPGVKDFFRSSQTPPTSPTRPGPSEEFIIEGLDKDDGWIMVEDEFYTVAQSFTKHLHHAEYTKRKREAKARTAAALSAIERPIDGRTPVPKELQRRKDAEALAARQKAGLEELEGPRPDASGEPEDEDQDDTWAGTHLHGFMASPRKSRSLVGGHAMKSSTRAAAGFGQTSQPSINAQAGNIPSSPPLQADAQAIEILDETASEEDLDADCEILATPTARRVTGKPSSAQPTSSKDSREPNSRRQENARSDTPVSMQAIKPRKETKSRVQMLFDELDKLPEPSESNKSISDKKNTSSGKSSTNDTSTNDNLASKSRFNNVPTFLV